MSRVTLRPGQWVRGERHEFAVREWVGEGSYSRVYRGEGPSGPAAIKLAKVEVEGAVERLSREREAHRRLSHPAIPALCDAGHLPDSSGDPVGAPWLAVRWVDGETLRCRLERTRALPLVQVVPALVRVADAIATLHAAGWVHSDLRPDNVLLERGTHDAFLLDLGEARSAGSGDRALGEETRRLGELLVWSMTGTDPAREPERLGRAGGYHPLAVELWHEARAGRLSAAAFRDQLLRLARQLGLSCLGKSGSRA